MNNLSKFSEAVKKIPYKKTIMASALIVGSISALGGMQIRNLYNMQLSTLDILQQRNKEAYVPRKYLDSFAQKSSNEMQENIAKNIQLIRNHFNYGDYLEYIFIYLYKDKILDKTIRVDINILKKELFDYFLFLHENNKFHPEFSRVRSLYEQYIELNSKLENVGDAEGLSYKQLKLVRKQVLLLKDKVKREYKSSKNTILLNRKKQDERDLFSHAFTCLNADDEQRCLEI